MHRLVTFTFAAFFAIAFAQLPSRMALKNGRSGGCLTVLPAGVSVRNCLETAEEVWVPTASGGLQHSASGLCLSLAGPATNTALVMSVCNPADSFQTVTPVFVAAGTVRLFHTAFLPAGTGCIGQGSGTTNLGAGSEIVRVNCNGQADDKWSVADIELFVTGTILDSCCNKQWHIVQGGITTIILRTQWDTYVPALQTDTALQQTFLDSFLGKLTTATNWNGLIRPAITPASVSFTWLASNQVQITLPAFPAYAITTTDFIVVTLPGSLVTSGISTGANRQLSIFDTACAATPALAFTTRPYTPSACTPGTTDPMYWKNTVDALPAGAPANYCNRLISNQLILSSTANCNGPNDNLGFIFEITVQPKVTGQWRFRSGSDFGLGGGIYIDNTPIQTVCGDLWWNFDFANVAQTIVSPFVTLSRDSAYTMRVYGLEDCCGGGMSVEFEAQASGLGWQASTIANLQAVAGSFSCGCYTSCDTCTADTRCGWCVDGACDPSGVSLVTDKTQGLCVSGTSVGPDSGTCARWMFTTCLSNPSVTSVVVSDPDNLDSIFSAGDVLTITFSTATNQIAMTTYADINRSLAFSQFLGTDYTGVWTSATVLTITIVDASGANPTLGTLTVTVLEASPAYLLDAAGCAFPIPNSQYSVTYTGNFGLPPKLTLSGTAGGSTETQMSAGGRTIIITLNGGANSVQFQSEATIRANAAALFDVIVSNRATGWNQRKTTLVGTDITSTGLVITITVPVAVYDVVNVETLSIGSLPSLFLVSYPNPITTPDVSGTLVITPAGGTRRVGFANLSYVMTSETALTIVASVTRFGAIDSAISVNCELNPAASPTPADPAITTTLHSASLATSGADYTTPQTTALSWITNESADKTCTFTVISDAIAEGNEWFSIALTGTASDLEPGFIFSDIVILNVAPVAKATTLFIAENSAIGTALGKVTGTDTENDPLSFARTGGSTLFSIAANGDVTTTGLIDFEATSSYTVSFTASDAAKTSAAGTLTVVVLDVNEAPTVTAMSATIPENSAVNDFVMVLGKNDPDTTSPNRDLALVNPWSFAAGGNPSGIFGITATLGTIFVASTGLDFETTNSYTLSIRVCDAGAVSLCGTGPVTVTITDVNEAPTIAPQAFSIAENSASGAAVGTVVRVDPDTVTANFFTTAWAITAGDPSGVFAINAATGAITVATPSALNFEVGPNTYTLTVTVRDDNGAGLTGTGTVTITVTNENEAPAIANQAFSIAENSASGAAVGTVVRTDPDTAPPAFVSTLWAITAGDPSGVFAINSATGAITVATPAALDFEGSPTSFSLSVTVRDDDGAGLTGTGTVTITVTNVNEAPAIANQAFNIAENSGVGTAVGTVVRTDPDTVPAAFVSTLWAITAGDAGGVFAINAATGAITVATPAALDFETGPNTYTLTVTVRDDNGAGLTGAGTVTITVTNVNEAPAIVAQARSVKETVSNGSTVGTPIASSDPDTTPASFVAVIYSIEAGNAAGIFAINSSTGQITVANAALLDADVTPTHILTVRVTNNLETPALFAEAAVTVTVTVSPCGDGEKHFSEACDDGNLTNGDGCSSICAIEPGSSCTVLPGPPSVSSCTALVFSSASLPEFGIIETGVTFDVILAGTSGITWASQVGTGATETAAFAAALAGTLATPYAWASVVIPSLTPANVDRISPAVVRVTLPPLATFAIDSNDAVTVTSLPASLLSTGPALTLSAVTMAVIDGGAKASLGGTVPCGPGASVTSRVNAGDTLSIIVSGTTIAKSTWQTSPNALTFWDVLNLTPAAEITNLEAHRIPTGRHDLLDNLSSFSFPSDFVATATYSTCVKAYWHRSSSATRMLSVLATTSGIAINVEVFCTLKWP